MNYYMVTGRCLIDGHWKKIHHTFTSKKRARFWARFWAKTGRKYGGMKNVSLIKMTPEEEIDF